MTTIIHRKRPSLENGQQREKEGWQILCQLGWPIPNTRGYRGWRLQTRTTNMRRNTKHKERVPSQILLQLENLLYRILVTLGVLFFLTWHFSLRRVLAKEFLTRHPNKL